MSLLGVDTATGRKLMRKMLAAVNDLVALLLCFRKIDTHE
jgi:hypothetical protein